MFRLDFVPIIDMGWPDVEDFVDCRKCVCLLFSGRGCSEFVSLSTCLNFLLSQLDSGSAFGCLIDSFV